MTFNKKLLEQAGFSQKAIDYISNNKNVSEMKDAQTQGTYTGSCGDTIIVYLKINNNNIIEDASFIYTGCVGAASSGSAITELVKKKSVAEARELILEDIIEFYKEGERGLPKIKHDCGEIAVKALQKALDNWQV